jgi:hypothetical protein
VLLLLLLLLLQGQQCQHCCVIIYRQLLEGRLLQQHSSQVGKAPAVVDSRGTQNKVTRELCGTAAP